MKSKKKTLVEALIYVLLIIVCVWLVPKYVVQRTVVSGESMQDTLQNGESLSRQGVLSFYRSKKV